MTEGNDPRVYLAAERTLLAWVRTGLAVIGLGFVVARFGLFLRIASQRPDAPPHHLVSTVLGVALVLLGVTSCLAAAVQHLRFCKALGLAERPRDWWTWLAPFCAFALAAIGLSLAVYLVASADGG